MPFRKRLIWQIYFSYLIVIIGSFSIITWEAVKTIRQSFLNQLMNELKSKAYLSEMVLKPFIDPLNETQLLNACREFGIRSGARITVVLPRGRVVADSLSDPGIMDNHSDRVEIAAAIRGEIGAAERPSPTMQDKMLYLAVPVRKNQETIAVVRAASPMTAADDALRQLIFKFTTLAFLTALGAAILSYFVSLRITRPVEDIAQWVRLLARGDLGIRLRTFYPNEMGALAVAVNDMAGQLKSRIDTILMQRNEMAAVLSSITEGIVAVDREEKIIRMNNAAAAILGCSVAATLGRSIQETVRSTPIHKLVKEALEKHKLVEMQITLPGEHDRHLNVRATMLKDQTGSERGVVLALTDITAIKRLERVRKDFVANVSHEIKTPITAIKGFVETLQEGGIDDPSQTAKFLSIIERQVTRLEAIIEDLLILSRLEQESGQGSLRLQKSSLKEVISSALQACEAMSMEKDITLKAAFQEELFLSMDASLFEQALVNLLDNAIKYSDRGKDIRIDAGRIENEAVISVIDEGCGIPREHLPRIFERFYRVDKARSRESGGTGLGLAIVKHIVQAHSGRISVESVPGKGSTFRIHLPVSE